MAEMDLYSTTEMEAVYIEALQENIWRSRSISFRRSFFITRL